MVTPKKVRLFVVAVGLIPCLAYANIILRDTFEDTPDWKSWVINTSANGLWDRITEDPKNEFASQSHGLKSLWLKDSDDSSYAYASTIFRNSAGEYLIEFYVLIPKNHVYIDSFPLCILRNSVRNYDTDISVFLTTADNGLEIYVADSSSVYSNVAYVDSLDRWYKMQIYRYSVGNRPFVGLYIDGQRKGTYNPMHSSDYSNQILLGSSPAFIRADGEVFYDDVIVSTPSNGEHPRLLFDRGGANSLRRRMAGGATYLGVDYAHIWDSLRTYTDHFVTDSYRPMVWKKKYNDGNDSIFDSFSFPYRQFRLIPRRGFDHLDFWLGPQRRLASELMALAFVTAVDGNLIDERERARDIIVSLSHWQMWNDPYFRGWYGRKYVQLGVGHFMFSLALAYDWLYAYLSNYERMSIQNTLISLGINQAFLEACYGTGWGRNPSEWPNGTAVIMGGMAMGCLSLDGCNLDLELGIARERIYRLLGDDNVCNQSGAFAEGISYAGYAVDHLVTFCEADNSLISYTRGDNFLANYSTWRIWSMLPGAERYYTDRYYPPTFWDITFCDYDKRGGKWTTAIALLVDLTRNPEARWFLKKRMDLRFSERNSRYDRWDLYIPFGLFLWTDGSNDISRPESDTLLKIFTPAGWAIARTGWSDTDYILALKGGHWFRSHNHHEQGSFVFGGHGRWLVADMGYAENDDQKGAVYHNVLFEKNSEVLYRSDHNLQSYFAMNDGKSYSYIRTTAQSEKSDISLWQRSIVFFNHLGSFVMLDYAETKGRVESVSWRMHTWIEPTVRGRDNRITVSYPGGPNLRGLIAFPQDVVISHEFVGNGIRYRETDVSSRVYRFNRINVDLPGDSEVYRLVTGFVPYDDQESVVLEPVSGVNFEGVMAESRLGTAAALFCKDNSKESGSYRLPVADSPFNVVTNLVPNKQYRISVRRNGVPAANYRKVASSVGTIDFAVGGQGIWQISIEQMP